MEKSKYPFVVIGAGAGGLVIALGLKKAGKKVLLVEKGHWGGDCTNFGCIPSKALIAAAERKDPHPMRAVKKAVNHFLSHENPEALQKLGLETLEGTAEFIDPHTIRVGKREINAKTIVIAAGSRPQIPEIEGLEKTPYLTNETVFSLEHPPKSLIVLGGGPIGSELALAFQKLQTQVFLVHKHRTLLTREPKIASDMLQEVFAKEGAHLFLEEEPEKVSYDQGVFTLRCKSGKTLQADALLVATGRKPNCDALKLECGKIDFSQNGIVVDAFGRTSQKHIFAVGDIQGPPFFTHRAENQARAVLTTLLFSPFYKKKLSRQPIPRVTYTTPEIASIGDMEEEAIEKYGKKRVVSYFVPLKEVDRAVAQEKEIGFLLIVTKKWSSRILGATLMAPRAGEMLMEVSLAMAAKWPLRKIASIIHPYPTFSLGIRKASDLWLTQTLLPQLLGQKR